MFKQFKLLSLVTIFNLVFPLAYMAVVLVAVFDMVNNNAVEVWVIVMYTLLFLFHFWYCINIALLLYRYYPNLEPGWFFTRSTKILEVINWVIIAFYIFSMVAFLIVYKKRALNTIGYYAVAGFALFNITLIFQIIGGIKLMRRIKINAAKLYEDSFL